MVGQANDPLEDKVDRVADQVMRIPEPQTTVVSPQISRKYSSCEEEEGKQLRGKPAASGSAAGDAPAAVTALLQSPGQPLEVGAHESLEPRLGHDLSDVGIHTGPLASRSAEAITARACTVGRNVVFRHGEYAPDTTDGRRLLAHELAHVLQQRPARSAPSRFVVSNRVSKIGMAWGRSDVGACPAGPACGRRAAKVKPAADAGPNGAVRRGSDLPLPGREVNRSCRCPSHRPPTCGRPPRRYQPGMRPVSARGSRIIRLPHANKSMAGATELISRARAPAHRSTPSRDSR